MSSDISNLPVPSPIDNLPPETGGVEDISGLPEPSDISMLPVPSEVPAEEGPTSTILQSELQEIQRKYQLSPQDLDVIRRELPAMGTYIEGEETSPVKRAIGFIGRAAGVQELASKISREGFFGVGRESENVIRALEELQDISRERRSGWETAAEVVSGIAIPVGAGIKSLKGGVALGAGLGAATGYGGTKEGEEVPSTLIGAGIGAGLGLVGGYLGKVLSGDLQRELADQPGKTAEIARKMTEEVEAQAPWRNRVSQIIEAPDTDAAVIEIAQNKQAMDAIYQKTSDSELQEVWKQLNREVRRAGKKKNPNAPLMTDEMVDREIASRVIRREVEDVLNYLEANGRIDKVVSKKRTAAEFSKDLAEQKRLGVERIKQAMDELEHHRAATKVLANDIDILTRKQPGTFMQWAKGLLDGRVRLGLIDDRIATSLEVAADRSARDMSKFTNEVFAVAQNAKRFDRSLRKAGLTDELARSRFFDVVNNPDAVVPDAWKPLVAEYKQYTDDLAERLNAKMGTRVLNPMKDQRYALNTVVEMPEFIRRISQKLDAIQKKIGIDPLANPEITRANWNKIKELKEFDEFRRAIELFGRPINDADSFVLNGRLALSPSSLRENFETISSSLLKREGDIPDFLLEKDPAKLLVLWADRNLRSAYINPFLSELRKARNIALQANDKDAVEYTTNLIKDLSGVRRGTFAASIGDTLLLAKARALQAADRMPEGSLRQKAFKFMANAPDLVPMFGNQVYPNFMGFSPKAIVGNLTQPFMMTLPELGPLYGSRIILESMSELVPQLGKILRGKARDELLERGLVARQYSTELAAVKEGLNKGALYRFSEKALEKQAEFAMWAFNKSEEINRILAANVAKRVAGEYMKRQSGALNFIKKMPPSYQRAIKAAGNDSAQVTELMENFIIAKTLFNYNRQTLSAFGRFMGPMLSVFTKWPSSIAGDIYRTFLNKGAKEGGKDFAIRYLGPLATAVMVQQMLPENLTESERFKAVFGKEGIASSSPILTTKQIAEGQFFAPPAVTATKDLATGILTADPSKVWKWFNNTTSAFVPGAWMARILGRDQYRWRNEEAPEGTFIQKLFPNTEIDAVFKPE